MVVRSGEVWGAGIIYGKECRKSDQVWGVTNLVSYLSLVYKLDSAWNFKGLGRLGGEIRQGDFVGEGVEKNVFLNVYVDWIGYRKFFKTLRTYV